jgi:ribosomal protein S18 acetylase RimI-like enzyme
MANIIRITSDRWKEYKMLRLEALKNDPMAFTSSYEEEQEAADEKWIDDIKNKDFLFAEQNGKLIGMSSYSFETKNKTKHIANIWGVYVSPEHRGKGIGNQLLITVIGNIKQNKEIRKIRIGVNSDQIPAKRLYERAGFKVVGTLKNEIRHNGKFYDETIMEMSL